jgi:hypothetical protein
VGWLLRDLLARSGGNRGGRTKSEGGSLDCGAPTQLKWMGVDLSRSCCLLLFVSARFFLEN